MPRGSKRSEFEALQTNEGWVAPPPFICGLSEGSGSELFEESQQLVVRLKALWSAFHWIGLGQGLFLQCKVGIQIS